MSDDVRAYCVGGTFRHFWRTVIPFPEARKDLGGFQWCRILCLSILRRMAKSSWVNSSLIKFWRRFWVGILRKNIFFQGILAHKSRTWNTSWNTSLDCQAMKTRVILKKVKNRLKFNFTKIALEFNPCILGRRKRDRSVSQAFSDRNNLNRVIFVQFDSMAVLPKNHKS